jgi:type II secretory pathway pseudopilin PulG
MTHHRITSTSRSGFSLIEVIIATAILMGSAVVLAKLAGMGREQSQKARIHSQVQEICEQTMNEMLLGLRPIEAAESVPWMPLPIPIEESTDDMAEQDQFATADEQTEPVLDEASPEWRFTVRMELLADLPGMWALTVIVQQGDETLPRPVRSSLTRWISGPAPEGSFESLSQDPSDPSLSEQEEFL